MNSPHERPVTRKMFPFDDVIMVDSVGLNVTHGEQLERIKSIFEEKRHNCSNVNKHGVSSQNIRPIPLNRELLNLR